MLNASQASCRNEWLTVLLWDLLGLKGKIIAPNMGKKNGSSITFIVSFSAQGDGEVQQ